MNDKYLVMTRLLFYDMLPLMEMMEAPDKSEFFYPRRTEDDWEKKIF
ncbi:TPA: DNA mismatch repair protein MutT [Streptococcus pneumoniae]|nr:mutT/nudix family protein [Streptococcus pneumoniae 2071004]CMU32825.1 hydrolase [Streptococcus pneumoniae]CMX06062.1 hydrolase [Streptococcus pneumoniae]CMY76012.1 hydrolase [Streptococcus pneumoniae]CNB02117.1 hydrolase [Streptococcus pneumoniae]